MTKYPPPTTFVIARLTLPPPLFQVFLTIIWRNKVFVVGFVLNVDFSFFSHLSLGQVLLLKYTKMSVVNCTTFGPIHSLVINK